MRVGPAALSFPGEPERIAKYAEDLTALTHPNTDCRDASVIWSVAIDRTIQYAGGADEPWDFRAAVLAGLERVPSDRRERWEALIDEACTRTPGEFKNNGWVVHAFQAALSCIRRTGTQDERPSEHEHLQSCIEAAVRCGGDTDTVAAIAGALAGARWGASALPAGWRAELHGRRIYGQPELTAADLEALARAAIETGA